MLGRQTWLPSPLFPSDFFFFQIEPYQGLNIFLTKQLQVSCRPRIKYFGLPISVAWPVYRNVNDEETSFGISLKGMYIVIIIAFKGAIRDFLQSLHGAANRLQHVRSSGPGAIVCKPRATHRALITCKCHVTCHLVRRDSSAIKFDRVEIAFI